METKMENKEGMIDKLRKLMAMADGAKAIGNLAEAEAFAAKAQELLLKYKLDMSDVEFAAEELNEPVMDAVINADEMMGVPYKSRQDRWAGILINGIAKANFCRVLGHARCNRYSIVGRASDRAATTALFVYLSKACKEMAPQAARDAGAIHSRTSFITAFNLGFAAAIAERLATNLNGLKAGLRLNGQQTGLVRIDQMVKATNDKFRELFPRTVTARATSIRSSAGYYAGKTYGAAVGINKTLRLGS
jgi:hypothetical protein